MKALKNGFVKNESTNYKPKLFKLITVIYKFSSIINSTAKTQGR